MRMYKYTQKWKKVQERKRSALTWKRKNIDGITFIKIFRQLKRLESSSEGFIYAGRSVVSPELRVSFSNRHDWLGAGARRRRVSRKRLSDYVCPATGEGCDESTSVLYIGATYIIGSKTAANPLRLLLVLLFHLNRFFIVLFSRPACLFLSRLYIDQCFKLMYTSVRTLSISILADRITGTCIYIPTFLVLHR